MRPFSRLSDCGGEKCAQQVAGADLAVENPFEARIAFAPLRVKFGHTATAARRLSSRPLGVSNESEDND
jgi:hypothetical protein